MMQFTGGGNDGDKTECSARMDDPGLRRKDIVMIKLHDIQKDYGTYQSWKISAWQIIPGKIYGLIGPNGAGKTTF